MYLVRHGATAANLRSPPVLQGHRSDLPLSPVGVRQAEACRDVLRPLRIHSFLSSPLRRAVETAQIIAGTQVDIVPEITECDVGVWEGLSWEEVRQRDATAYEAFMKDPHTHPYAGGESFGDVHRRAIPAFEKMIRRCAAGDILVVTHNVVARVYIAHLLRLPAALARNVYLDNGGITVVAIQNGSARLITTNSAFHLPEPDLG